MLLDGARALANLRFTANCVHGCVFGQGDVDIVQARLQVDS
jgi:hypothetical protein